MGEISTQTIIENSVHLVRQKGLVQKGEMVVLTAGDPATNMVSREGAMTNMMHVIEAK